MAKKGEAYYRYSYEELSAFCLQISLLLEAAVPLEEGLAIMAEDAASQGEKDMLLYMAEGVELGDPFFKVMEDTGVFPAYVVRMAKLGQQTGTMDQMMKSLELRHPADALCLERHSHPAGRCPNSNSLFPPQAAVVAVAGHSIARPIACGNRVPPQRNICLGNSPPSF